MNGAELFEKFTNIDDKYIMPNLNAKHKNNITFVKMGSMVAMFAVVVAVLIFYNNSASINTQELPILTIEETDAGIGMGFGGYLAYDISDLSNTNPWNKELNLTHLPVFKNPLQMGDYFINTTPNHELMEQNLIETAEKLGIKDYKVEYVAESEGQYDIILDYFANHNAETSNIEVAGWEKHIAPSGNFCYFPVDYFDKIKMFIETDEVEISTDVRNQRITIEFKHSVSLPQGLNLTYDASYEELQAVAEYLKVEYVDLLDMEKPVVNITGGDYFIDGEQNYDLSFYEGGGDITQDILNYNFNTISFSGFHDGALSFIDITYTDLSDVIGNYPIISSQDALELLKNGNYITTVPWEFASEEHVQKVELVYRNSAYDKIFMPYYCFYVELAEEKVGLEEESGLNGYGLYYVPAIEAEYIENMPMWKGEFN